MLLKLKSSDEFKDVFHLVRQILQQGRISKLVRISLCHKNFHSCLSLTDFGYVPPEKEPEVMHIATMVYLSQ